MHPAEKFVETLRKMLVINNGWEATRLSNLAKRMSIKDLEDVRMISKKILIYFGENQIKNTERMLRVIATTGKLDDEDAALLHKLQLANIDEPTVANLVKVVKAKQVDLTQNDTHDILSIIDNERCRRWISLMRIKL